MKKTFILVIFFQFFLSCNQEDSSKTLIKGFIDDIVLKDSYSESDIEKYLDIYKGTTDEKQRLIKFMTYFISLTKEQLSNTEYEIIGYSEVEQYSFLKKDKIYSKLEYNDLKNVYYLTSKNRKEMFSILVLNKQKTISFFPHMHKGTDPVEPFLLNLKPDF